MVVPEALNEVWSMDFMHDQLSDGRLEIGMRGRDESESAGWTSKTRPRCSAETS
jgi:hypothetical protein